ncbi:MAG: polyphenol oxidase family protein [Phycisphaerales bacterium]|nr:polyphenol oxidase family protein [Phycisphaerales bacterium]
MLLATSCPPPNSRSSVASDGPSILCRRLRTASDSAVSAVTGVQCQQELARWRRTSILLSRYGFPHGFCHLGRPDDEASCAAVAPGCVLQQARQVHGPVVVRAAGWSPDAAPEADAVMSPDQGIACAVRTADCAPVLVGCSATGAVAAIHAGWRGISRGVIGTTIRAMIEQLGSVPHTMVAAIGPCARGCHYEIGEEVASAVSDAGCASAVVRRAGSPRPFLDVAAAAAWQLAEAGVPLARIDADAPCSIESHWCPSHRRDPSSRARMLSMIAPRTRMHHG